MSGSGKNDVSQQGQSQRHNHASDSQKDTPATMLVPTGDLVQFTATSLKQHVPSAGT